ncbi:MAG: DUF262 domain-containing protein [Bacteroides sp.]|nr:DUF262 domain-containing protein [Bacteroides sp.]
MNISLHEITVRELTAGYADNNENGVVGYGGKLDIRPPYQREFIYKEAQRNAVIDTILKGFPLNVMYWAKRDDGTFEVIDGQQRTISICQYVQGDYSIDVEGDKLKFFNFRSDVQQRILDYKLTVYFCEGSDTEKLSWFRTINIAGEKLTDQELRNAVYSGSWVTDAKRYFSKPGCAAYKIGSDYLTGTPIRQDYLETAIDWISKGEIKEYMACHQHDPNAARLWQYFQSVITWVSTTFPKKRSNMMKGIAWGPLYDEFKDKILDAARLEEEIKRLILDDDVTAKKGIYPYVLTRKEKYLSIRAFSDQQKIEAYERQQGICPHCHNHFELNEMEGDHIKPWHAGGKTTSDNCQMLCRECNRRKSGK